MNNKESIDRLEKSLDEIIEMIKLRKANGYFTDIFEQRYVIDQETKKKIYIKKK